MKKSVLTTSVAALLVAGWVGSSWYTGKILEKNKDDYTEQANQQLPIIIAALTKLPNHPTSHLQLKLTDFERGIFSSKVRYYLYESKNNEGIYINANVEHGPFPLSELASFRFMPKAAAIHLELEKNSQTEFLFMLTQQQSPFKLKVVPENKKIRAELRIAPTTLPNFKLDETQLNMLLDEKQKQLTVDGEIKNVVMNSPDISININGITFDAIIYPGQFYQYRGYNNFNFEQINIQNHSVFPGQSFNYKTVNLNKLSIFSQIDEEEKNVHFKQAFKMDKFLINDADLGTMDVKLTLNKLDGNAIKQLFNTGNQHDPHTVFNNLFSSSPEFKVDSFIWKNKGGTGHYSANVLFNHPGDVNLQGQPKIVLIKELIKEVDSNLSMPLPMFEELLATSLHLTQNVTKEDAEEQAKAMLPLIAAYLNKADKNKMVILNNEGIKSDLHYENETVLINGEKKSLTAFLDTFEQ